MVQEALSATLPVLEFVDRGLKARGTLRTKGELCNSQGGDRDTVEELGTLQATDDRTPQICPGGGESMHVWRMGCVTACDGVWHASVDRGWGVWSRGHPLAGNRARPSREGPPSAR